MAITDTEPSPSAKTKSSHFILPIFLAILISAIFAQIVMVALPIRDSTSLFGGIDKVFAAFNILIIALVSITSFFLFLHFFNKKRASALRVLIAAFILGGVLSTLLFGKLAFTFLGLASPLMLLVVAIVTYSGAYFAYLVLVDALSRRTRNLLFVFCSGALGSFLGVLMPPVIAVGVSLFLSVLDLVLIERRIVENMVGEEMYENLLIDVTFSHGDWGVGIGDLTCYAMVVSNALVNFGILTGILSLVLILIGVLITLSISVKRARQPGLPIATALGVLPSIVFLFLL